jgi:hypothetical protein
MTAPDPLQAIAGLRHCVQAGDYAGATLRVAQPAVLDAIASLAAYAAEQRAEADEARREAAAAQRAEAERARVQAGISPLLEELIGVLAGAMGVSAAPLCIKCRRALRRRRNCPYCGTRDARSAA